MRNQKEEEENGGTRNRFQLPASPSKASRPSCFGPLSRSRLCKTLLKSGSIEASEYIAQKTMLIILTGSGRLQDVVVTTLGFDNVDKCMLNFDPIPMARPAACCIGWALEATSAQTFWRSTAAALKRAPAQDNSCGQSPPPLSPLSFCLRLARMRRTLSPQNKH